MFLNFGVKEKYIDEDVKDILFFIDKISMFHLNGKSLLSGSRLTRPHIVRKLMFSSNLITENYGKIVTKLYPEFYSSI